MDTDTKSTREHRQTGICFHENNEKKKESYLTSEDPKFTHLGFFPKNLNSMQR